MSMTPARALNRCAHRFAVCHGNIKNATRQFFKNLMHLSDSIKFRREILRGMRDLAAFLTYSLQSKIKLAYVAFICLCSSHTYSADYGQSHGGDGGEIAQEVVTLPIDSSSPVEGMAFSTDGQLLAGWHQSAEISVWSWKDARLLKVLHAPKGANSALVTERILFSPDGAYLAACHSRASTEVVISIWATNTWTSLDGIRDSSAGSGCSGFAFSRDGKTLFRALFRPSSVAGDSLIAYDTGTLTYKWGVVTAPLVPFATAGSPDGHFLALGGIVRRDSRTGSNPFQSSMRDIPGGRSVVAIIDLRSQQLKAVVPISFGLNPFSVIRWSPDGRKISVAAALGIETVDTGELSSVVNLPASRYSTAHVSLQYAKAGRYIVESTAYQQANWIKIFRTNPFELQRTIPEEGTALAVTIDQNYLAAAKRDHIVIYKLN
jgi:hypothetical protein